MIRLIFAGTAWLTLPISRVGQNRMYTPYMTVYMIYGDFPAKNTVYTMCICMVLANVAYLTQQLSSYCSYLRAGRQRSGLGH